MEFSKTKSCLVGVLLPFFLSFLYVFLVLYPVF
jgi:hypothetical protein